jgi:hypothetical protein
MKDLSPSGRRAGEEGAKLRVKLFSFSVVFVEDDLVQRRFLTSTPHPDPLPWGEGEKTRDRPCHSFRPGIDSL